MTATQSATLSATCHCGAIHLTLPADAAGILACHCTDCQKTHGNFNAFLAAPVTAVVLQRAQALVWHQSSPDSRRAFCGTCGARVLKEVTPAGRWLISAGLIDGPIGKRILRNLWPDSRPDSQPDSRPDWYALPAAAG